MLLIPSALVLSMVHSVSWPMGSEGTILGRNDLWHWEYGWYALAWAALVILVFAIIEEVKKQLRP